MSNSKQQLADGLRAALGERIDSIKLAYNEVTAEIKAEHLISVATELRDDARFRFQQLVDLCGVDYSQFGRDEWLTEDASRSGFSRGVVDNASSGRLQFGDELDSLSPQGRRFAAVYHLLSYANNQRLRLRVYADDDDFPVIPTITGIWRSADWYEREAFDLFGIMFSDHPDLRRILTDYGFVGHPFRKDFPLVGHVEMRYDPERERVVYEPVSIEPRVLVPRVKRSDHRYLDDEQLAQDEAQNDA
ncbi:MAG: NADH-quinone oxidoreductase subunit C [Gammaproteobacteria bacterium]|nr:NADH-quinone oxidoreductase subunit C [Gammaproteobacteria bacterium]MDH3450109.1 NADH-quinone oxidoreductase subunit C [Gammaproteobacteria bacterium]